MLALLLRDHPLADEQPQRDAALRVLEYVQSQREFIEVCEHLTPSGEKIDADPKRVGENKLWDLFHRTGRGERYLTWLNELERNAGETLFPEKAERRSHRPCPR